MKKLVLLLLITTSLFAQNEPNFLFANKENNLGYGGAINTTLSTTDNLGNTYIIGSFANLADFDPSVAVANLASIGSSDMFIAKYDSNGNYLWAENIGGLGTVAPSAIVIGGGFIYLAGNYTNIVDFDPSANVSNLNTTNELGSGYLAKYDLNGFFVLSKSLDGIGTITINDMKFLSNQVVITGYLTETMDLDPSINTLQLTSNGLTDAFIAKYSNSLLLQSAINFGGSLNDMATSLALDSSGNIIISGSYLGTVDFDPSASDNSLTTTTTSISHTFIGKYNSNLIFQWVKGIGGRSSTNSNSKLVLDSAANILITGSYTSTSDFDPSAATASLTASNSDVFIAKYDANGNYAWAKKIGGTSSDYGRNIAIDASNNIHIYGTYIGTVDFNPDAGINTLDSVANGGNFFAKFDSNGIFLIANSLKATINTILVDSSNSLILTGTFSGVQDFDTMAGVANLYSLRSNVFLAKYDNSTSYVFAKLIGGDKPTNNITNFVATDGTGNIYRVGSLSATTDLDPSAAVFNLSSPTALAIFIAKYTPNGSLLWAKSFSGGTSLVVSLMNTDINGNTYITGRFLGTVDFDPSANTANLTSTSSTLNDMYIAKYDSNGNYLWAKQLSGNVGGGSSKRMLFDTVGNFYFTGRISGTDPIDFDPSPTAAVYLTPVGFVDTFFAKYSPQGDYIWAKSISGVDSTSGINETHIELKGNSIYLTGLFSGSYNFNPATTDVIAANNGLEGYIAKYDLNGNYQFASSIALTTDGGNTVTSNVVADDNDNFYLFTTLEGTADFDLLPASTSFITSPSIDVDLTTSYIISKYSPTGDLIWAKSLNQNSLNFGTNRDRVHAYINNNELIVAFQLYDSGVDLDPSGNNFIVNSNPLKGNIIVAKYNTNTGDFIWGNKIEGDYDLALNSTNFDINANLLLSGSFTGTAEFDFSSGVQNLTSASIYNYDRFWAKYGTDTLGLGENIITKGYAIYPNPTNSMLFVSHELDSPFKVTIIDITGKILQKTTIDNQKGVDVSAYPQGIYFIQIDNGLEKNTYKFIKK